MKASIDEVAYAEAFMNTPFNAPHDPRSEDEAFRTPGCGLKSCELETGLNHWPRYFGRLTSYDEKNDAVVVVSKAPMHGIDGKKTVWTGTIAEYNAYWRCD
jgi:hypothetical protein